jgi:GT2 family glycosyltransferase
MANLFPLVSIIMPAYNAAAHIAEAIESVLAQSYSHWELWIIDDASQDNTDSVVSQFLDSRIRYHRIEKQGRAGAVRNVGLRQAQGDLIAFLDADDVYFPDALEALVTPFKLNPSLIAVYGFANYMDEHGKPIPTMDLLRPDRQGQYHLPKGYDHSWRQIITGNFSCMLPGLMLRRETLERIGYIDETFISGEDYEFYLRLFLDNHNQVHCLPRYIYRYRVHSQSLTKCPEQYQAILESCLAIADSVFSNPRIPDEALCHKSMAYWECFRYLARERLIHGQPSIARHIILQAFCHRQVATSTWLLKGLPLFLRTLLPTEFNHHLISIKCKLKPPCVMGLSRLSNIFSGGLL